MFRLLPIVLLGMLPLMAGCGGDSKPATPPATPAAGVAAAPPVTSNGDPRAQIFLNKGCPQCHSIRAFSIKSPTDVGPDLTMAATDVQSRFGMKLEEFLKNPTGTMMVVLSAQIQLSETERDSIIEILEHLGEPRKGTD